MKIIDVLKNIIDKTKFALWGFEEKFSALRILFEAHSTNENFSKEESKEFEEYLQEFEIEPGLVVKRNIEDSFRILKTSELGLELIYIIFASSSIRYNGNIEGKKHIYNMINTYQLSKETLEDTEKKIKETNIEAVLEKWNE